ncbi:MAG: serine/threonine protein kinase [Planctomycetales bacterium]|nr:serine/threonine protein kinase [Planctomycetales bacterium]
MTNSANNDLALDHTQTLDTNVASGLSSAELDSTALFEVKPPVGAGDELGPYRLINEIGRGAMGAVYQAEHTKLRRRVALKILPTEFTDVPARLSRFQREMEAIGRLDHENIVRAHDAGEFDGTHYISMELINGRDVNEVMKDVKRFDIGSACEIARQTALGLKHISENQLVHRDIKPSNLLITETGTVKILDLGIVRLRRDENADSSQTSIGSMIGTPDYMAPEQIESSNQVDIRADIYSLGCTLYTLLAGRPPFYGEEYGTQMSKLMAHVKNEPPNLSDVASNVPQGLANLVHRLMEKKADDRIQDPQDVAEALSEWADRESLLHLAHAASSGSTAIGRYQEARDNGALASPAKSKSVLKWTVAAGCAGVVGLFALASLAPSSNDPEGDLVKVGKPEEKGDSNATLPVAIVKTPHSPDSQLTSSEPAPSDVPLNSPPAQATVELQMIAESTETIAENSTKVVESTDKIDKNTERIADTLEGLRDAFRMAARSGDLVNEPKTVAELYHNAQVYQRQGNFNAAREMYLSIFEMGGDFVDVHESYQALLTGQLDKNAVKEAYDNMPGDSNHPVRRFAYACVQDDYNLRTEILEELVEARFPLAAFELSRDHSADVVGRAGLGDKANERKWLKAFRELAENERISQYYLDPAIATEVLADTEQRWVQLRDLDESVLENPVNVQLIRSVGVTSLMVSIAEPTLSIEYRLDKSGQFKSTGYLAMLNPATGKRAPNSIIRLPRDTTPQLIEIEYEDVRNQKRGPFVVELGDEAVERDMRNQIELASLMWVKFIDRGRKQYLDMQLFAAFDRIIREVHFGINVDEPDQELRLVDPEAGNQNYRIPVSFDDVGYVVVQVHFTDGTKSDIKRFDRPDPKSRPQRPRSFDDLTR